MSLELPKQKTAKEEVPEFLYKIVDLDSWKESQEASLVPKGSLDTDFIHLATKSQLERVLAKFWNKKSCAILKVESSKILGELKFEKNADGLTRYYHLYDGEIPLVSVKSTVIKEKREVV